MNKMKLDEQNYEFIKALDIIAHELIRDGEIISDKKTLKGESELVVKNDDILYELHMLRGSCKSIAWESK